MWAEELCGRTSDGLYAKKLCTGFLPANSHSRQRPLQHSLEVWLWGARLAEAPWVLKSAEAQWVQG